MNDTGPGDSVTGSAVVGISREHRRKRSEAYRHGGTDERPAHREVRTGRLHAHANEKLAEGGVAVVPEREVAQAHGCTCHPDPKW